MDECVISIVSILGVGLLLFVAYIAGAPEAFVVQLRVNNPIVQIACTFIYLIVLACLVSTVWWFLVLFLGDFVSL